MSDAKADSATPVVEKENPPDNSGKQEGLASPGFGEEPSLSAAFSASEYPAASSSVAAPAAGAAVPVDPFLILPPELPTQVGPKGVRFDFNDGARVWLPKGQWHVEIHDAESGNVIFVCDADEGWVVSAKKYYVPFVVKIWERGNFVPLVDHALDLKGKPVLIKFPVGTLGDLIGWFPYAEKFLKKHGCLMECALGKELIEIYREQYPEMTLSVPQEVKTKEPYASYRVGLFFGGNVDHQPIDFRQVGLHRTAGHILGVDPKEEPPRLNLDVPRRPELKEQPYVCIATKSSCQAKFWNNGHGWNMVVGYLKALGYRVLAIDRDATVGLGFTWNQIPHGAEDFTGNLPLSERIALLRHADFFVGLSSGLSWLAWACQIPVVLISGFTLPICEFETPYRAYSSHGCKGCWDDTSVNFDHRDFFWCPRHKGTERQYECTRLITGRQVIGHIDRLMRDRGLQAPNLRGGGFVASLAAETEQLDPERARQAVAPLVARACDLERVAGMFEDEASREQYLRELRFMILRGLLRDDEAVLRLAGNVSVEAWNSALDRAKSLLASHELPELQYAPSAEWVIPWMYASLFVLEQYSYGGAAEIREGDVFLDCGACCGETAVWAVNKGAGKVFAFEPNPEAHAYLLANAEKYGLGRIFFVPAGVGAASSRMNMVMEAGNIGGARLTESSDGAVPVTALDDWCRENAVKPDFIKMDVEGWEMKALQGARQVITECRPRLAVCLYHRLADMWEIPLLLKEMAPEYRFWCRKNAPFAEFVLYASI